MIKPTLTIGIPAYNEEKNIGQLLRKLILQSYPNFNLTKIIVVSDRSSDKTDQVVKSFKDHRILLHRNTQRSGTAISQNTIKQNCNTDYLIILHADIAITDNHLISKIISELTSNKTIGLVTVRALASPGKNIFQKILNHNVNMKNDLFENWNNGNNIYTCRGICRGFSKKFLNCYTWPKTTSEDADSYLNCIKYGFRYSYLKNTCVYFQSPNSFMDHQKQSIRFARRTANPAFSYPLSLLIRSATRSFVTNPLYFILYLIIRRLTRIIPLSNKHTQPVWSPSVSTKNFT